MTVLRAFTEFTALCLFLLTLAYAPLLLGPDGNAVVVIEGE